MSRPATTLRAGDEHVTDAKMPPATPATQENQLLFYHFGSHSGADAKRRTRTHDHWLNGRF
jgi:hypothetical protein